LRIAIAITTTLPDWTGGMEHATNQTAEELTRGGHEVHVITSLKKGKPRRTVYNGYTLHRVPVIMKPPFWGLTFNWGAFREITKIDPDAVICQCLYAGLAGYLAKRFSGKPYLICGHGLDVYGPWAFKSFLSGLVLKQANAVLALTEDMKSQFRKFYDRDVTVIPNGVEIAKYGRVSRADMRTKFEISPDSLVLICVARLNPVKGINYLIGAMPEIRTKFEKVKLYILGSEQDGGATGRQIEDLKLGDCVVLTGRVPDEQVAEYLAAGDIFVLPSLSEGFGIVFLEAMSAGLPIISTRVGGIPEVVIEGKNGFLAEPANSEQLAEKLIYLAGNPRLMEEISINNRRDVERYSLVNVVKRIEEILVRVTKENNKIKS
jgi:glycosyltransferase involved in cell wall biosynthesis